MSQLPALLEAEGEGEAMANVVLKGTTRGLEIVISGEPTLSALRERLIELLAEAPSFFAGSNARIAIDGALPVGALTCLEDVATRFELRIVEIGPVAARRARTVEVASEPPAESFAEGSGRISEEQAALSVIEQLVDELPTEVATDVADVADAGSSGPRIVNGPVRSGVIVEHRGHVIVIGDVNPGAEVRAEGSIIVLGRLRGVAHAAIGRDAGFIIALSLQPQQLRIGRMVARAGDVDRPSDGAEIAYATGVTIVVERFSGRLSSALANSL